MTDIRYALRALRRNWIVSLLAVLSLGLAIGGNSTVFSLVYAILFRPLPYENAETIHMVWQSRRGEPQDFTPLSPAEFFDYRERAKSIQEMVAFGPSPVNLIEGDRPEQILAETVSVELFSFLGVNPILGRTFSAEEAQPGRDRVAVLSFRFWEDRLGAAPDVLGRTLILDSEPFVVVGVMPDEFAIFTPGVRLWIPLVSDPGDRRIGNRRLFAFARLKPGVPLELGQDEITSIGRQLEEEYPEQSRGFIGRFDLFYNQFPNSQARQLYGLMQGGLIFVLLIACANIANLLLVRGYDRQREFALRTALGAAKGRILRQLLTESTVLSFLGGALGLALGIAGITIMNAAIGDLIPRPFIPKLEPSVLLFTFGITVFAGLACGLAPALQGAKVNLIESLRGGGHSASAGTSRRLLSRGLVVAEVALALVLLAGAGVLIDSFDNLQNSDYGFPLDHLLTMQLTLPQVKYAEDAQLVSFYEEASRRLGGLPDVRRATSVNSLPRSPYAPSSSYLVDGRSVGDDEQLPNAFALTVDPNYLETMQIKLLKGRGIEPTDRAESAPVALVSRELARRNWPDDDPVGRRIDIYGKQREVVGVVENAIQGWVLGDLGPQAVVYLPQAQLPARTMFIVLRTRVDPANLQELARREIENMDPALTIGQVVSMQQFVDRIFVGVSVFSIILGLFGMLALALASVGIYGVLAYSVAQRRYEIGVRIAIGASRASVVRLVIRRGLLLAAIGFGIGLPGVVAVTILIGSALSGISKVEPASMLFTVLLLAAVSAIASYLPARRASALDPIVALRQE